MAKQETWDLKNVPLDRASSYMIASGTALLVGVISMSYMSGVAAVVDVATAPEITTDPATGEKKKGKKGSKLINAGKRAILRTFNEIRQQPALAPLSTYWTIETGRHMYQELTKREKESPDDPGIKKSKGALASLISMSVYVAIGATLLAAGWSLWLSLHPEVMIAMINGLATIGEVAIDEMSEVIEAYLSWVPDELSVVGL